MNGTCESCGRDDEVVAVRRLYVTPEAWDTPEKVVVGGDELWCLVCRTHYPHQIPASDTVAGNGGRAGAEGSGGEATEDAAAG